MPSLLVSLAAVALRLPLPADVVGSVFVDRNANGRRDPGEPGLAGVAVSNQDTVVVTDSAGAFRMTSRGTGVVFVSTPNGYAANGPFWRDAGTDAATPLSFGLVPLAAGAEFSFLHASDTHISTASLPRTRRFRAIADSLAPDVVLITGDLVRDALRVPEAEATGYYDLFMGERNTFRSPVFTVPGNHENFGIERDTSHVSQSHPLYGRAMYRHYLGPDYYSFTRGGVHFIGLNTVDIDDQRYYGHVDSVQVEWLKRDLALLPPGTPVVTFDHIPFLSTFEGLGGYSDRPPAPSLITVNGKTAYRHVVSNTAEVLGILRRHNHVLALGGHVHATERIEFEVDGVKTRFNQVAGVIGAPRAGGMTFVSGVTLYRVRGGVIDAGTFVPLGRP
jgi:Icc-related predicted phosphoesterase